MMKYVFAILSLSILTLASAQNLLHNPDFELSVNCPSDTAQMAFASEWLPACAGADYFDSCCNSCRADVPLNFWGYKHAYSSGHGYAGFFTYKESSADYRGYLQGVIDPLTSGHWYRVTVYVTSAGKMKYATNGLGVFFFINQTIPTTNQVLSFSPQIDYFQGSSYVVDTSNWLIRTRIFYADSSYTKI